MREFFKLLPPDLVQSFNRSDYELKLTNGSEILFRSLDNYDSVRGIEVAYVWIDEANLISVKAWRVVIGRMRQPGFAHRSWITTTPRGKTDNWLYEEYIVKPAKDPEIRKRRKTYHAVTRDNVQNTGLEYLLDLESTYTGDFAKQELLGQFVDIIEGRVYPQFERKYHVDFYGEDIVFEPAQPLYAFWDYGFSDEGALWLAQTVKLPAHKSIPLVDPENDGEYFQLDIREGTGLMLLDVILEDGQNADFWVETIGVIEDRWKPIDKHFGDPAGEQRELTTGKSMADHLREAGIFVRSKKAPTDKGRLLIHKLLNERRLFISSDCQQGIAAFQNYHWPLDPNGKRKDGSRAPVHDWSSHPMDALRYGVTGLFPIFAPSKLDRRNLGQRSRSPMSSFTGRNLREERW